MSRPPPPRHERVIPDRTTAHVYRLPRRGHAQSVITGKPRRCARSTLGAGRREAGQGARAVIRRHFGNLSTAPPGGGSLWPERNLRCKLE